MISRPAFFDSISDIQYPEMLVEFFDQFVALKQIVEDYGKVSVINNTDNSITFLIAFNNTKNRDKALSNVQSGNIIIYGRQISIQVEVISETEIKLALQ